MYGTRTHTRAHTHTHTHTRTSATLAPRADYSTHSLAPFPHTPGLIAIWSSNNKLYDNGAGNVYSADGLAAMARYAVALASRYNTSDILWEMTNEPNTGGGYGANASLYAHMTSVVATAVHAAVKGVAVVGPASGNTGLAWLQDIFEAGVLTHFDKITIHPYRSDAPEMVWSDWGKVERLVSEYAPVSKLARGLPPVLSGEWGYGAASVGGKLEQAELLARVLLLTTSRSGGQPSIWYQACSPDPGDGEMVRQQLRVVVPVYSQEEAYVHLTPNVFSHPTSPHLPSSQGIMNCSAGEHGKEPSFTPFPAYFAAQYMNAVFRNDGKAVGSAPLDPDVAFRFVERIAVFQNGIDTSDDFVLLFASDAGDLLLVAWTSSDFQHIVRIPGVVRDGECFMQSGMLGATMGDDPLARSLCHDPRGLHVNVSGAPRYLVLQQNTTRSASSRPVDTAAAATSTATRTCSFPATKGLPFCNTTAPTDVRVADLVARLTSAEKLSMMLSLQEAAPRLKVNAYDWGNECLHGVALESGVGGLAGATIFPQPIGLGASFNPALLHAIGDAISTESRALSNAGVEKTPGVPAFQDCWAPNMNIYRDPR